jgi:prolyl oligopeptidase
MDDLPAFRKFFNHTAFIEGWGLYSESLGPEMGFYADPYSRFGWLSYDMWRAIRLVVDTGMHAFGWSRQQAIDYFRAHSSKTEQDIMVEVDRYIVWPGQALAYKIGQMKIQELRRAHEQRLGSAFNLRDFHDRLLSFGSLPLSMLQQLLA